MILIDIYIYFKIAYRLCEYENFKRIIFFYLVLIKKLTVSNHKLLKFRDVVGNRLSIIHIYIHRVPNR